jgi:hypothetical protein
MSRKQTDFDGQETDRKTGKRPANRKQAGRHVRPMRTTGNGPMVLEQTVGQEIDLQLGNSPMNRKQAE